MTKVVLGDTVLATIGEAKQFLRSKIKGYKLNKPVPDEDYSIWFSYLQKHEWFDRYVEFGIHRFVYMRNKDFPTSSMAVENQAGERWPFSFHRYLDGKPLTKLERVKITLRMEIADQIETFRNKAFDGRQTVPCALTGAILNMGQCAVHHAGKPFVQIADEFLEANKHRWSDVDTEPVNQTLYRLIRRDIAAAWADFHRANAVLQIAERKANRDVGSGGYRMRFQEPATRRAPMSDREARIAIERLQLRLNKRRN